MLCVYLLIILKTQNVWALSQAFDLKNRPEVSSLQNEIYIVFL